MVGRSKIAVIGGGQIGTNLALLVAERQLGDVVVVDVLKDMVMGKSLDLNHFAAIQNVHSIICGTNDYEHIRESDVVIITAGVTRKPDMTREALLEINGAIIKDVGNAVKNFAPNAFCIVVTNPLDAMVAVFWEASGLPSEKVCGMAGILDSGRFKYLLARRLEVSVQDVQATVIGGHCNSMVPLLRYTTVAGINLVDLIAMNMISKEEVDNICHQVVNGGMEIISLLKTASAFCAPAIAAIDMAESYLKDKKRVLPCSVFLNGQYNVDKLFVGVPCVIGKHGIEKIIELQLNCEEKSKFQKSVADIRELVETTKKVASKA